MNQVSKSLFCCQVSDEESVAEISSPVSGVILTLLSNLRLCFLHKASSDPSTIVSSVTSMDLATKPSSSMPYTSLLDSAVSCQSNRALGLAEFSSSASMRLGGRQSYDEMAVGALTQYSSSLQLVLTGIVEYLMQSSKCRIVTISFDSYLLSLEVRISLMFS